MSTKINPKDFNFKGPLTVAMSIRMCLTVLEEELIDRDEDTSEDPLIMALRTALLLAEEEGR